MSEVLLHLNPQTTEEKLLFERHFNALFVQEIKQLKRHIEVLQEQNELLESSTLQKKVTNQRQQLDSLHKQITSLKKRCNDLQESQNTLFLKTNEDNKQDQQEPKNKTFWQKFRLHRS